MVYALRGFVFLILASLLAPVSGRAQEVTLTPHHTFRVAEDPTTLAFSGDGRLLLAGSEGGQVVGWDVERKVSLFRTHLEEEVLFLDFLAGDTSFVAVDGGGAVSVGGLRGGRPEVRFRLQGQPLRAALDAGRRYLAVATEAHWIALFDLRAGMRVGRIDAREHLEGLLFLGFDRLGEELIAITRRGDVLSWNPRTRRLLRKLSLRGGQLYGSRPVIRAAAADRAADVFVVGLQEVALPRGGLRGRARPGDLVRRNLIIAYDGQSGIEIKRMTFPDGAVDRIVLGPGSDHAAVTGEQTSAVTLVDLRNGELESRVTAAGEPVVLAISEDDRWLAAATGEGRVAVWKLTFAAPPTAERLESRLPTLSGRIRVLSEKTPAITPDTPLQLAVLPFDGSGEAEKIAQMCSEVLTTQLANVEHLTLLERKRIDEVLDELHLQASGLTVSDGARLGRLLNADYLILGGVNALGTTYLFNARLLRVATAQIVKGRQVICEECRFQDVFDAMFLLGTTLAR